MQLFKDKDTRKQNMDAAIEGIAELVLSGAGDEVFANYLKMDRFLWRFSFNNQALLLIQNATSRRIASLPRFSKVAVERGHKTVTTATDKRHLAVRPKKGTHALYVWTPWTKYATVEDPETGKQERKAVGKTFQPGAVWAVEDLYFCDTGEDVISDPDFLPDFVRDHGEDCQPYYDALLGWLIGKGITVKDSTELGGAAGVSYGGTIALRTFDPVGKRFSILTHEAAHELLHKDKERQELPKVVKETEAEAVAGVVCEYFGFGQADWSAAYLRNHGATKKTVLDSMKRIYDASRSIIEGIEVGIGDEVTAVEEEGLEEGLPLAVGM